MKKSLSYSDYAPSLRSSSKNIIDLSMIENPWGPSPSVLKLIKKNSFKDRVSRYFPVSTELLGAIARSNALKPENVALTDGADGALTLLFLALASNKRVVVTLPSFPRFHYYCALASSTLVRSKLEQDTFTVDKDVFTRGGGVIAMSSPNNPTGIPVPEWVIKKSLSKFGLVVIDEALLCLDKGFSYLIRDHDNLVIARSFSKTLGLAGMRIGYALGSEKVISRLNSYSSPFKVSAFSQLAALATLKDDKYISMSIENTRRELSNLCEKIPRQSTIANSTALCYLAKLKPSDSARLKKARIMVTSGGHFDYLDNSFARISIGRREQNERLVEVLRS